MTDSSTIGDVETTLRAEIAARRPGERLPSSRTLVERHRVSPVTVARVIATLSAEGLVESRPGAGTYVAAPSRPAGRADYSWQTLTLADRAVDVMGMMLIADPPHDDGMLTLATGYLHRSLMPLSALGASLAKAARTPDVWERPPPGGIPGLRTWFARSAGRDVDARDVLVTPGGQGAISAAVRALVPAGSPLLVESPTYTGVLAVARAAGIRTVPVPTDAGGVVPDALEEAFGRTGAQAFYVQPTFHNPTGRVLAPERRRAVLDIAADAGAFVIEDDYARWLTHAEPAPPPLLADDTQGRVITITSLTKPVAPSLRVGAIVARGPVGRRLRDLRVVDDMFVSRPLQEATLDLVGRPAWDRHVRALGKALTERCGALAAAVARYLPTESVSRPAGGMHLWVGLPPQVDDVWVAEESRREGVLVLPGRGFYPAEQPGPYLRMTFTATPSTAELEEAVIRVAGVVGQAMDD